MCWSWLTPAHKSDFYISCPSKLLGANLLVAEHWLWQRLCYTKWANVKYIHSSFRVAFVLENFQELAGMNSLHGVWLQDSHQEVIGLDREAEDITNMDYLRGEMFLTVSYLQCLLWQHIY